MKSGTIIAILKDGNPVLLAHGSEIKKQRSLFRSLAEQQRAGSGEYTTVEWYIGAHKRLRKRTPLSASPVPPTK